PVQIKNNQRWRHSVLASTIRMGDAFLLSSPGSAQLFQNSVADKNREFANGIARAGVCGVVGLDAKSVGRCRGSARSPKILAGVGAARRGEIRLSVLFPEFQIHPVRMAGAAVVAGGRRCGAIYPALGIVYRR